MTMILGQAHMEEESNRTIGLDILSYIDETHGVEYKIFDFGGHDVYHYTHRFFLTHLGLYLLCVDLPGYRSGEFQEHVGKWMTSISSHVTKPSLIVVGTKTDECDVTDKIALLERDVESAETAVRQALQEEISRCQKSLHNREQRIHLEDDHFVGLSRKEIVDKKQSLQKLLDGRPEDLIDIEIVPVSSKRNEGIDLLRTKMAAIVQERLYDSSTGRELTQSWSDLEKKLKQEKSKACLNLKECKQLGEDVGMGSDDVLNALEYLHVTGEILFYRHIQGMEDKVFQYPSIILKLFKQLFRHDMAEYLQKAEKLRAEDRHHFLESGVVSDNFVDAVLSEEAESFRLLLPLMKHFGLCFNTTVTMMANVPNAKEDEVADLWPEGPGEGRKEIKITMKSLDVNSEHPIGLGESLACRIALMSEEGRSLVKRDAVINKVGNVDVMYCRVHDDKKPRKGETAATKSLDEIHLRTESKQAWRGVKDLVNKITPCLEEYRARLSEDRVTISGDKRVTSIPLEALHMHTAEDLDKIFLGEWTEPTQQPGVRSPDNAIKIMIDNSLYALCSKLGDNFRRLATNLGLQRLDIEVRGLTSDTQRAFQALQLWRKKSRHGPLHYLPYLMRALKEMHLDHLALDLPELLKEYRQNLPLTTVNPEKTIDIEGVEKWSLPHEGRFYCQGSDLQVITPYPLYVTSVLWSGEPWTHGSLLVPVGPQFHFQFRCDDAREPVEIDLPLIANMTDYGVNILCMDYDKSACQDEVLFEKKVKAKSVTALLSKDARVGPVAHVYAVFECLHIDYREHGFPENMNYLEELLNTMGYTDLSKFVYRKFQDYLTTMDKKEVQPDVSTDVAGVTKFRMTLPTKGEYFTNGKYLCKETDIGIITSYPMTMTYQKEPVPGQFDHWDDWVPVGPTFSIQCDVRGDRTVNIMLPHVLHLSKDDIMSEYCRDVFVM
ncbi:MFHAS1 [Branchiostoma lanceolatum]|uniref:MFHAS1 protein n=1 Tax=Branchiostoma lanceolatum TaxID=7740 RepID=A0A8K0AG75_BRALA|nr:MFHAS1 [Branchiostoma lanceolatum]